VVNEFQPCDGGCNVRGTLAMAKLEDEPDSATNSWFINLADNSANLDVQNEGFATFGRVLGDGMSVVDAVAALPRCKQFLTCGLSASYPDLPLRNYAGGGVTVGNLIFVDQIVEVPEPGVAALRTGALASVLLLARLSARRRGAGRRP
jgi:peptidyl-prolyl cis-trans isomerase A (cyclophilin A)